MRLIDSHCHFLHERFAGEVPVLSAEEIYLRAKAAGVTGMVGIATVPDEWQPYLDFARGHEGVWVAAGLHPNHVHEETVTAEGLRALATQPHVVALGETGLDYHYLPEGANREDVRRCQHENFHLHMQVARETGLPVVVHTREAEDDTLAILRTYPEVQFVLHCFTGSLAMAEAAVAMGGYISFSGVLTFKKSQELRNIATALPGDRILVETDAPYLAPEPHRGRRCEPAQVTHTAAVLAACRSQPIEDIAEMTVANTRALFTRMRPAP